MGEQLSIVGSGVIATGLAAVASRMPGHRLWARSPASSERAKRAIAKACERLGEGYEPDHVTITLDLDELSSGSFFVEAVAEDLPLKRALLAKLNKIAREDAVIATTTSSLPVVELATSSGRPDRFVGLHVFNPVPKMKLVELAFPKDASPDTRARARALCVGLDKEAVEVPPLAGFVVNRLLFPYLFGAVEYLESVELPPEAVDQCMQNGAGHPMGPIALLDYIGLDVSVSIGDALGLEVPQRLRDLVAEGALGRKTGRGLYPESTYS
ncbi:MAG: 3-hydroxyacyl-CoA dehydrogenase family protein [Caulobacteraceae bacterium]|nr:3-hydroxyacyl-CoA dehydrogenase family protein [Caulobacteraceae bacterium]